MHFYINFSWLKDPLFYRVETESWRSLRKEKKSFLFISRQLKRKIESKEAFVISDQKVKIKKLSKNNPLFNSVFKKITSFGKEANKQTHTNTQLITNLCNM